MFENIKNNRVNFPSKERHNIHVSNQAKDLILKMLNKDKTQRIGAKGGMTEILKHPFFEGLDLKALKAKTLPSPYKPNLQNDKYKFFDPELKDQPKEVVFSQIGQAGENIIK